MENVTGIQGVEVRATVKHPIMHRTHTSPKPRITQVKMLVVLRLGNTGLGSLLWGLQALVAMPWIWVRCGNRKIRSVHSDSEVGVSRGWVINNAFN